MGRNLTVDTDKIEMLNGADDDIHKHFSHISQSYGVKTTFGTSDTIKIQAIGAFVRFAATFFVSCLTRPLQSLT